MSNVHLSTDIEQGSLSLATLVDVVGSRSIRILTAPSPADAIVTGTELVDATDALPELSGTVLFVVSGAALPTPVLRTIAERAASYNYAALAMKTNAERREELRAVADDAGIALIEVADHVSWRYLEATIDGLLGEHNLVASSSRHPSFEPLFSLVNTVAERFGGSVVIEDLSRSILAYSSVPDQLIDKLRTEGILTRRAPYSPFNDEQYRQVLRAETVTQFAPIGDEVARIAIAIRAGSVPLGTLWAIDGRPDPSLPISAEEIQFVTSTAETAASHMLDNLRIQEANQKPREAMLRRLLNGTDVVGTELAELGMSADRGVTLSAFSNPQSTASAIALAQLRSTVAKHYSSYRDDAISVSLGGTVYTLLGTSDSSEVKTLAERVLPLLDRAVGEGSRAALAQSVVHSGEIARSRQELDEILRCAPEVSEPRILQLDDVQPQLLINSVGDLLRGRPLLSNLLLSRLASGANQSAKDLAQTIEVWCSEFGNVARTAEILGVHENTVRYRMQRVIEQHGLNLHDPDVMLTVWLQLRAQSANQSAELPAQ